MTQLMKGCEISTGGLCHLPTIVSKGTVGFGHAVGVVPFLDTRPLTGGRIHQFAGKLFRHSLARALAGALQQPADCQTHTPLDPHFNRDLHSLDDLSQFAASLAPQLP